MKFSFFLGLIVDGSASPPENNACAHGVNESRHALRRRRVGSLGICIMSVGGQFFYLVDFHIASPAPHRWTRLVRCVYILGSKSFGLRLRVHVLDLSVAAPPALRTTRPCRTAAPWSARATEWRGVGHAAAPGRGAALVGREQRHWRRRPTLLRRRRPGGGGGLRQRRAAPSGRRQRRRGQRQQCSRHAAAAQGDRPGRNAVQEQAAPGGGGGGARAAAARGWDTSSSLASSKVGGWFPCPWRRRAARVAGTAAWPRPRPRRAPRPRSS